MPRHPRPAQLSLLDLIDELGPTKTKTKTKTTAPTPVPTPAAGRQDPLQAAPSSFEVSSPVTRPLPTKAHEPGPERPIEDRVLGLTEQIRRDLAVLAGPPTYCCDRAFYEARVSGCRQTAIELLRS